MPRHGRPVPIQGPLCVGDLALVLARWRSNGHVLRHGRPVLRQGRMSRDTVDLCRDKGSFVLPTLRAATTRSDFSSRFSKRRKKNDDHLQKSHKTHIISRIIDCLSRIMNCLSRIINCLLRINNGYLNSPLLAPPQPRVLHQN